MEVRLANLQFEQDADNVLKLLSAYAEDPMGGGLPLSDFCRANLIPGLVKQPQCFVFLAFENAEAVGMAICFEGFSTFAAKPLLNIHDLVVMKACRGKGIGQALLAKVAETAKSRGCCKVTLEVLSGNQVAMRSYERFGFEPYSLDPETGTAVLLQFKL